MEVKKTSKKNGIFTTTCLLIYQAIKEGLSPSEISKLKQIPKQNLNYYISFLKNKGIILKKGYGLWGISRELSEEQVLEILKERSKRKFSIGMRVEKPITNLHALQINFPIISGEIKESDWEIKNKLNHWIPKYTRLESLGGITIRNNNNKSLTAFAKSRDIENISEIDNLAFKIKSLLYSYFRSKYNVVLDIFNCETKNMNIATQDREAEGMLRKGEKFELNLNKKAEKIFEKDKINAKAWLDGSPFEFSAETNDKEWKRAYLQMPFMIKSLANSMPAIQEYARNIELHKKVQQEQLQTLKQIRKEFHYWKKQKTKEIKEGIKYGEQTKLWDFF